MIPSIAESVGQTVAESVGRVVGLAQEQRPLPADLLESEDAYLVVFDAPGAQPGDVQVRYEDRAVFARVDRFRAYREGFEMVFPGRGLSLEGKKTLPPDAVVDPEAASAALRENGTLAVELPKIATADATQEASAASDTEAGDAPEAESTDEPDTESDDDPADS